MTVDQRFFKLAPDLSFESTTSLHLDPLCSVTGRSTSRLSSGVLGLVGNFPDFVSGFAGLGYRSWEAWPE